MTARALLIAAAVAWVAALVGLVSMMMLGGMRPQDVLFLLTYMDPVLKAFAVLSVVWAAIGITSVRAGARDRAAISMLGAFGFGALGAVLGAANAPNGLICINPPIPFAIYAPDYAQALIVLLVGLSGAILCLALLAHRGPRQI